MVGLGLFTLLPASWSRMRDPYLFSPKITKRKKKITEKHTTNFAHFSCHDERRLRHIFEFRVERWLIDMRIHENVLPCVSWSNWAACFSSVSTKKSHKKLTKRMTHIFHIHHLLAIMLILHDLHRCMYNWLWNHFLLISKKHTYQTELKQWTWHFHFVDQLQLARRNGVYADGRRKRVYHATFHQHRSEKENNSSHIQKNAELAQLAFSVWFTYIS